MIRVITTGRLQALEADQTKLAQALDAADIAQAEQQETREDLERVRKVADDLLAEVAKLSVAALAQRYVYILFHHGAVHGVFASQEAARKATVPDGEAPRKWVERPEMVGKPVSADTRWFVYPVLVTPEGGDAG